MLRLANLSKEIVAKYESGFIRKLNTRQLVVIFRIAWVFLDLIFVKSLPVIKKIDSNQSEKP